MTGDKAPRDLTTLYRYFDADGRLLYAGITGAGAQRADQHAKGAIWWPQTAAATLEHYATREEALAAELVAIRCERPLFNRRDHPDLVRPPRQAPRPPSTKLVRTSGWIGQAYRLRARGWSTPEISAELGVPASTITVMFREERSRRQERLRRSWRDLIRTIHRAGWPRFEVDQ